MQRRHVLKWLTLTGIGLGAAALSTRFYSKLLRSEERTNILIAGTGTMAPYVKMLGQAFSKNNTHVDITIEKGHSRAGLIALQQGGVDIAMMSHDLGPKHSNLNTHNALIGIDAIALVVHPDSAVSQISMLQARKVFEGHITSWMELGGRDARINLYGRTERSTTRESMDSMLMDGEIMSRQIKEFDSPKNIKQAVSTDINGIGYLSARNVSDEIKVLEMNEIVLEEKELYLKQYPLTRDLFLVFNDDVTPIAKQFIDFTLSEAGQKILAEAGLLRVR